MVLLAVSVLVMGQTFLDLPNEAVRRRLTSFQATEVESLEIHLGKALTARGGHVQTLVSRDPRLVREWKRALAASSHRTTGAFEPEPAPRARDDSVGFWLVGGGWIGYRLHWPNGVASCWGPQVENLLRRTLAGGSRLETRPAR